jgi:hypothetical protein
MTWHDVKSENISVMFGQSASNSSLLVVWAGPPAQRLHREHNEASLPSCCNCTLKDSKWPHPFTYWGCSHVEEKVLERRTQTSSNKEPAGHLSTCHSAAKSSGWDTYTAFPAAAPKNRLVTLGPQFLCVWHIQGQNCSTTVYDRG